jgi:hypothetical protein
MFQREPKIRVRCHSPSFWWLPQPAEDLKEMKGIKAGFDQIKAASPNFVDIAALGLEVRGMSSYHNNSE